MTNGSSITEKVRRGLCVGLDLWHSYKIASKLVLRAFTMTVFAPLYHKICPGNWYFTSVENKMVKVHHTFTCLRLAYDADDGRIRKEMKRILKDEEFRTHHFHQWRVLKNIKDLVKFFIPAVGVVV